jgi:uncharacterized protein YndB with AHSA1/START domain
VAEIVSGVEIGRGAEEVFAYVTDPSRFGEWQGEGVKGHVEGDGPAHVGSRCVITRPIGGTDRTSTSEITEIDPPRTWAIRGIDGPIRANVHIRVDPLEDGGRSRVTITLEFTGYGIGKLIAPMVIREARKGVPLSCENLKKRLENDEKG